MPETDSIGPKDLMDSAIDNLTELQVLYGLDLEEIIKKLESIDCSNLSVVVTE